ncbi:hypothetical protein [Pontivivens insulae]|uniref:Uncharacterized protein n=1 Tax=Pontivivens insulae TaxID=1639689 RepID=A0A2R8AG62_9RHOB|nr:hypothetical protein [Pontivivens insulae]RED12278.1 hypothetical protein DFR53_2996 [Pontivivens insulae]SPF31035.1 hypothetical protein POI8812_03385 [Pontivivens insulae]
MIKHLLALALLATPAAAEEFSDALDLMGEQCVDGLMRDLRAGPAGMFPADPRTSEVVLGDNLGRAWRSEAGNIVVYDLDQMPVCGVLAADFNVGQARAALAPWARGWQLIEAPEEGGTRRFVRRYSDAEVLMVFVATSDNPQLVEMTGRILPANDWTNRILAGGN